MVMEKCLNLTDFVPSLLFELGEERKIVYLAAIKYIKTVSVETFFLLLFMGVRFWRALSSCCTEAVMGGMMTSVSSQRGMGSQYGAFLWLPVSGNWQEGCGQ